MTAEGLRLAQKDNRGLSITRTHQLRQQTRPETSKICQSYPFVKISLLAFRFECVLAHKSVTCDCVFTISIQKYAAVMEFSLSILLKVRQLLQ